MSVPRVLRKTSILLLTLMLFSLGCSASPPSDSPDITGEIGSIDRTGSAAVAGRILIGSDIVPASGYDKAWVTITDTTTLFKEVDGASPEPISVDDLAVGMTADVWFTGPVAESYPVQATAESILVQ